MKHLVETWLALSLPDCNDYGAIFVMATWIGFPIIIICLSGQGAVEQVEKKSNESTLWVQIMRINELWLLYNEIETRRHLSLDLDPDMDLERVTAIYSRAISSGATSLASMFNYLRSVIVNPSGLGVGANSEVRG